MPDEPASSRSHDGSVEGSWAVRRLPSGLRWVSRTVVSLALLSSTASAFVWPSDISRAEAELGSSDVGVRRRAARGLVELPSGAVLRLGLPALADADPAVRVAALEALVDARAAGLGRRVETWLADPDVSVRRAAARALSRDPRPEAAPALGRILSDPDASVRLAAARALGVTRARTASVSLLGRLDDPDPDVRAAVARALARLRDPGAVVPLVGKLQDTRANVRAAVVAALGALGDGRAGAALSLSLRDPDEAVRLATLWALSELRVKEALPAITALLGEERRPVVREAAFAALGAIPADEGLDALLVALAEDDPRERSPVRAALGRAGARALPRLEACLLAETTGNLADGCALSLGEMQAPATARVVTEALRRGIVRPLAALRALGAAGDPEGLPAVLELLGSEDPWIRRGAAEAAGALLDPSNPDGRAVEPLTRALSAAHSRRSERTELVQLLGSTGSPRATSVLLPLAEHAADRTLRLAALRALGFLGPAGQDSVLLTALGDLDGELRLAAALSLARTAGPGTASHLLTLLSRAPDQDRRAVGMALSGALAAGTEAARARAVQLLAGARGADLDALVEAIGRIRAGRGSAPLVAHLRHERDPGARAKIAEALGAHPEAAPVLESLLRESAARVRANAAWSLGSAGGATSVAPLRRALADRDAAVAANAAFALGRLAAKKRASVSGLCTGLADSRSAVRLSTLRAMPEGGGACPLPDVLTLLARDRSEAVRLAATDAVARSAPVKGDAVAIRDALLSCAEDDSSSRVAAACRSASQPEVSRSPAPAPGPVAPVSVYVVPNGAAEPVRDAAFGLVFPDGSVRFGVADRRGSVFEAAAPQGTLRLTLPAATLP